MYPSGQPGAERGFTLVELLIAMGLLSLILVLLFGGLRLGSRSWDALDRHVERSGELRLARGAIQRLLLQARPVTGMVERQVLPLFFGTGEQLEFVAPLSEYVGVGGLYLVRIYLGQEQERKTLLIERWLLHPEVLAGDAAIPPWQMLGRPAPYREDSAHAAGIYGVTRIADDVTGLEFAYFGAAGDGRDRSPQWFEEWTDPVHLPLLVRIRLMREGDPWPDLIVRLADG